MSLVVAVEVTDVLGKYNHSYHPQHGDAMSHQLLVGVLTRKTAARLQVWYRERSCGGNRIHMKVALSPGQRVTSTTGLNTTEKQDMVAVNTETILTGTMVTKPHLQILNI